MNAVQLFQPSTSSAVKLSFKDKLVNDLSSIVDDELWSDIEVKVQGKSFQCHKNILAARSGYFHKRLRRDRNRNEIVEKDGNSDAFGLVRRYIYTGTVSHNDADEELIANVLFLSTKYKLDELTSYMSGQMRQRFTIANAVNIFLLVSDINLNSIGEECLQFIRTHGEQCLQTEYCAKLNTSDLVCLLKQLNLNTETQLSLIRKWNKKQPQADATKMLGGEIDFDNNEREVDVREKQYILMTSYKGEIVILNGETFGEVAARKDPTMKACQVAVCHESLYVIDTKIGEIKATPVASLLKSEAIKWNKCADFESSCWTWGNVAVAGTFVYFMNGTHLHKYETISKTVTKLSAFGAAFRYYSLVELDGIIYGYRDNRFQSTDGINRWKSIDLRQTLGPYPYHCSLFKIQDSVFLVAGCNRCGSYLSTSLCYDTKSKSWTKGKSIQQAREWTATVSLDKRRTLVVGGSNGKWMDTIELFDEQSNEWHIIDYKVKLKYPQAVTFSV